MSVVADEPVGGGQPGSLRKRLRHLDPARRRPRVVVEGERARGSNEVTAVQRLAAVRVHDRVVGMPVVGPQQHAPGEADAVGFREQRQARLVTAAKRRPALGSGGGAGPTGHDRRVRAAGGGQERVEGGEPRLDGGDREVGLRLAADVDQPAAGVDAGPPGRRRRPVCRDKSGPTGGEPRRCPSGSRGSGRAARGRRGRAEDQLSRRSRSRARP